MINTSVMTAPRRTFRLANQLTMCTAGDFGMRGTPAYIAPELLTRDAACNATQAVDVYSFGVSAATSSLLIRMKVASIGTSCSKSGCTASSFH